MIANIAPKTALSLFRMSIMPVVFRAILPVSRAIVLEEFAPHMNAGVEPGNNRIDDSCRPSPDVQGRMEAMLGGLPRGNLLRILVGDPSRIDAVHVNAVGDIVGRRSSSHHVEGGLRHVRMRMANSLVRAIELSLDGGDVDNVLVALGGSHHQRLEPRVDNER